MATGRECRYLLQKGFKNLNKGERVIHLILVLAIVGFLCWLVLQIPMLPIFRNVILGLMVIVLIIWVLQVFGVNTGFHRLDF